MLEVKNVTVAYRKDGRLPVLNKLSLKLEQGRVLAVMGPSGCGKSTLLHTIGGILKPMEGQVLLEGAMLCPRRHSIGLIPQNYGLLPWKSVKENCLFGAKVKGISGDLKDELEQVGERLGITELMSQYPGALSGGQAQRVALARAFLMKPELLLMDEPFSALDIKAAFAAREAFLNLWRKKKTTAVIVTHRVENALYMADEIAVLGKNGTFLFRCGNSWQGVIKPKEDHYRKLEQRLTAEIIRADGL